MAFATVTTSPFASLLSRRGVSVLADRPVPKEEQVQAVIISGIRFFELHGATRTGPMVPMWHQRDGIWHPLSAHPVPLAEATARIARFLDLVADVPLSWSPESDAAELAAAIVREGVVDTALPIAA